MTEIPNKNKENLPSTSPGTEVAKVTPKNPDSPEVKKAQEDLDKNINKVLDNTKHETQNHKSQMQTEILKYLSPEANGGEEAVIKKFQKEHGLKETGILNAKTFNAIKSYNDEFLSDPKKFKEFNSKPQTETQDQQTNSSGKTEVAITDGYPEAGEVFMPQEIPVTEPITALESSELSKGEILKQLQDAKIDAKEISDKPGTYELDLAGLFDDSTLQVLGDNKMKFQTSTYKVDGKPKEFNISSVDELKTILKDINDLSKAKNNLNRLNDDKNPDNQFFKSDKITEANSKIAQISKNLESKA